MIFLMFLYQYKQAVFDFTVQYSGAEHNGFQNNWPKYGSSIKEVLKSSYSTTITTGWCESIEQILALMKILPAKSGTKTKSSVVPFIKAIDHLILFCEVT